MSSLSTLMGSSILWWGVLLAAASARASWPPETTDVKAAMIALKLLVRFSDLSVPA